MTEKLSFFFQLTFSMGRRNHNKKVVRLSDEQRQQRFDNKLNEVVQKMKRNTMSTAVYDCKVKKQTVFCGGVQRFSPFSANDLIHSVGIEMHDMSDNLLAGDEVLFGHLSKHVAEDPPKIRLYIRTPENVDNFARLQLCVERLYLQQSLGYLQGWIVNIGPVFILAPVEMTLMQSVEKVRNTIVKVCEDKGWPWNDSRVVLS
jgi:hypothetical protein